jgi:hypothetical protein
MQSINVKICAGLSCSDRHSEYIKKRLEADKEFYQYNDIQIYQNPVKSSELLRKKVTEWRKKK